MWPRSVCLINARVAADGGECRTLRFASRILALDEPPRLRDVVIDLGGAFVLPGLVNAHDHLELNHYGLQKGRDRYSNVSEWVDDMRPRLRDDPAIRDRAAHPLADRIFIGLLKNLLSGVTSVAHHNPLYGELRHSPLRIVRRFGWAHSFGMQHEPVGARGERGGAISARFLDTPSGAPFIVHLGEGVDRDARMELDRLDAIGCLAPHTVLVHGLAIDADGWNMIQARGSGVVWCPASNQFLFGDAARSPIWCEPGQAAGDNVALGTDSRLTGARDLLDELRVAHTSSSIGPAGLLRMVTSTPARLLRLPHAGHLAVGAPADLFVIPARADDAATALLATSRRDLELVVVGGRPAVGAASMASVFAARRVTSRTISVDGFSKLADASLVRRISRSSIDETGVVAG